MPLYFWTGIQLGGPEQVGEQAWTEARRRGWEEAQDTIVIGDGAVWIWNQATLHFGQSHQLTDWYHAKEHLVSAAKLLKTEGTSAYTCWLNSRERRLYQGHAARSAEELDAAAEAQPSRAEELRQEATYFCNNQHRMNYLEMREEEWPIGSGMVESGAKQFKARFCGPGMRWSRKGAENLLPIRAAVLSRRFDTMWDQAMLCPHTEIHTLFGPFDHCVSMPGGVSQTFPLIRSIRLPSINSTLASSKSRIPGPAVRSPPRPSAGSLAHIQDGQHRIKHAQDQCAKEYEIIDLICIRR